MTERAPVARDSVPASADIVIFTVVPEAKTAVVEALGLDATPQVRNYRYYHQGWVPSLQGDGTHFVVCHQSFTQSNLPALGRTKEVVSDWHPEYLIVADIGGGIHDGEGVELGDVVAHSTITYYEYEKLVGGGAQPRVFPLHTVSPRLREIAYNLDASNAGWADELSVVKPTLVTTDRPKLLFGEILSGDKLLDDPASELLLRLLDGNPKAAAVDMESGGVARALWETVADYHVHFLVLRGISDHCNLPDGKKTRLECTEYAANAAAAAAAAVVRQIPKTSVSVSEEEAYRARLTKGLDKTYRPLMVRFRMTLSDWRSTHRPSEALQHLAFEETRILLRGPAGAGKSQVLGWAARAALSDDILPVVLDLKKWDSKYTEELAALPFDAASLALRMEILLRVSIADLHTRLLESLAARHRLLVFVDGLNEVAGSDFGYQLLRTLDEFVRLHTTGLAVIVSDRMTQRGDVEARWRVTNLNPLANEEVKRTVDAQFSPGTYEGLEARDRELLTLPFFLDIALRAETPTLVSAGTAIRRFLNDEIGLDEVEIADLSELAYEVYEEAQSPSFDTRRARSRISATTWAKLTGADVLQTTPAGLAQFRHQLIHDYLVSTFLARRADKWNIAGFDVATLQASSFEVLSMSLEQVSGAERADGLLKAVYDWNWYAAIRVLATAGPGARPTHALEIAIAAVIAEKLFDSVERTRKRAEGQLSLFTAGIPHELAKAASPLDLINKVNQVPLYDDAWFDEWKQLFVRPPGAESREQDILALTSKDPVMGWTGANVARRLQLASEHIDWLRIIFSARSDGSDLSRTIRWRVIHSLGALPGESTGRLLIRALDEDEYHWVRYGAARSLVENAARTDDLLLRRFILRQLTDRVQAVGRQVLSEIGNVVFHDEPPEDWEAGVLPLMEMAREVQSSEVEREAWDERIESFRSFCERSRS
jgi:nucleoside phosphorylase